jgi:hypothetical protein
MISNNNLLELSIIITSDGDARCEISTFESMSPSNPSDPTTTVSDFNSDFNNDF